MIGKGIRFGMVLQLAVGPVCMLVFQTAATKGIWLGWLQIVAVCLVDGIYILLSGLGVATVLGKKRFANGFTISGGIILCLFGLDMIFGAMGISLFPAWNFISDSSGKGVFFQGFLLTASNPLTIVFWSGVFSSQVLSNGYGKKEMVCFGVGCVLATLIFLSGINLISGILGQVFPSYLIRMLHIAVGSFMIWCGIRTGMKGRAKREESEQ